MPTTPNRAYPYPAPADPVDIPGDMQALAEAIDNDLETIAPLTSTRPFVSIATFEEQNVPAGVETILEFDQVEFDNGPYSSIAVRPDRLILPNTGVWVVFGMFQIGDLDNTTTDLMIEAELRSLNPAGSGAFVIGTQGYTLDTTSVGPTPRALFDLAPVHNMGAESTPRHMVLLITNHNSEQNGGVLRILQARLGAFQVDV